MSNKKKRKQIRAVKHFTDSDGNWFIQFDAKDLKKIIKKFKPKK